MEKKGSRFPRMVIKYVGGPPDLNRYEKIDALFTTRALHVPEGNHRYVKHDPIIPESGVCLDFLGRPAIDWQGRVFQCVKLDVNNSGYLGDLKENILDDIWNSPGRKTWLEFHQLGRREFAASMCRECRYFGVPTWYIGT